MPSLKDRKFIRLRSCQDCKHCVSILVRYGDHACDTIVRRENFCVLDLSSEDLQYVRDELKGKEYHSFDCSDYSDRFLEIMNLKDYYDYLTDGDRYIDSCLQRCQFFEPDTEPL